MSESITQFTQLEAWKASHEAVLLIYKLTSSFPHSEQFGITSQLRRAASSVSANIAEGFGRYHFQDKIRFYYQARGSNSEVENFLILSKDLGFIRENDFSKAQQIVHRVSQIINGLIHSTGKIR